MFKYALRGFSVVGTLTSNIFQCSSFSFVWLPAASVGGHIGKVPTPYLRRLPLRHVGHRHWLGHSYIFVRSSACCGPIPTGRGQRQSLAGMSSHRQPYTVNDHITSSPTELMTTVTGSLIQLMTTVTGSLTQLMTTITDSLTQLMITVNDHSNRQSSTVNDHSHRQAHIVNGHSNRQSLTVLDQSQAISHS